MGLTFFNRRPALKTYHALTNRESFYYASRLTASHACLLADSYPPTRNLNRMGPPLCANREDSKLVLRKRTPARMGPCRWRPIAAEPPQRLLTAASRTESQDSLASAARTSSPAVIYSRCEHYSAATNPGAQGSPAARTAAATTTAGAEYALREKSGGRSGRGPLPSLSALAPNVVPTKTAGVVS